MRQVDTELRRLGQQLVLLLGFQNLVKLLGKSSRVRNKSVVAAQVRRGVVRR
jgi:hypothetical protein